MQLLDAHVHFWDPSARRHPCCSISRSSAPIAGSYLRRSRQLARTRSIVHSPIPTPAR